MTPDVELTVATLRSLAAIISAHPGDTVPVVVVVSTLADMADRLEGGALS